MNRRADSPLKVGDTVRYNAYGVDIAASAHGVILQRLSEHNWRVRWNKYDLPTAHGSHNLERVADTHSLDTLS